MYTANLIDYYYSFFTTKGSFLMSDIECDLPFNLRPEIVSFLDDKTKDQKYPVRCSWGKEHYNLSDNTTKAYTFNTDLD